MSDQTPSPDMYTAARQREQLGDRYRKAYREARLRHGDNGSKSPRMSAAAADIFALAQVFTGPDTAENFIEGIEREVDHDLNVTFARAELADALDVAATSMRKIRTAMENSFDIGDIEAEMTPEIETAFIGVNLHLAALRHFLRDATMTEPRT